MLGITALVIFAVSQAPAGSWCSLIALRPRPHVLDAQLAHCSNTIPRGVAVAPRGRGAPKLCPIASHRWVHGKSPSSNSSGLFGQVFCGCWFFFSSFFPFFLLLQRQNCGPADAHVFQPNINSRLLCGLCVETALCLRRGLRGSLWPRSLPGYF